MIDVCLESDVFERIIVVVGKLDRGFVGFFDHGRDGLQGLEREIRQPGAVTSDSIDVAVLVFLCDTR